MIINKWIMREYRQNYRGDELVNGEVIIEGVFTPEEWAKLMAMLMQMKRNAAQPTSANKIEKSANAILLCNPEPKNETL